MKKNHNLIQAISILIACITLFGNCQLPNKKIKFEYCYDINPIGLKEIDLSNKQDLSKNLKVGKLEDKIISISYLYFDKIFNDTVIYRNNIPYIISKMNDTDFSLASFTQLIKGARIDSNFNFLPGDSANGIFIRPVIKVTSCRNNYAVSYVLRKWRKTNKFGLFCVDTIKKGYISRQYSSSTNTFKDAVEFIKRIEEVNDIYPGKNFYIFKQKGDSLEYLASTPIAESNQLAWGKYVIKNYKPNSYFYLLRVIPLFYPIYTDGDWETYFIHQKT